jgi:hypothetical protein
LEYLCRLSHEVASATQPGQQRPSLLIAARRVAGLFLAAGSVATVLIGCTTTSLSAPDQSVVKCAVTVTGPQSAVAGSGGSGTVAVKAAPECAWSASAEVAWITDVTPAKGQGTGDIQFKAAPNPASATRQGDLSVNGTMVHVSQEPACVFDVTPQSLAVPFAGGSGSVTVTTVARCDWSAVSQVSWITVTSARENSGTGTITFAVAAGTDGAARTGSITVAGQTVTVSQAPCAYVVDPPTQRIGAAGGTGTLAVTTAAACTWTAVPDVAWITIGSGTSGTANGTVSFVTAANTGSARTGHITVGATRVTVEQDPSSSACSYSINPLSAGFPATGGAGASVTVAASPGCAWTATSNTAWIVVTSGASGRSAGSVVYSVSANAGGARSGTLLIAGQTFTVNQESAPCSFGINPTGQTVGNGSGTGATVAVTTQAGCAWTAAANDSWLTVNSPGSGVGSGSVGWTYAANPGAQRTGTMTIAGRTFTVDQQGPCTFTVAPLGQTLSAAGGSGTPITVTTGIGCAWAAVSNDAWITVTSGASGAGTGTVQITIGANVVYAARAGTLAIAGQVVTVIQNGVIP